MGLDCEILQAMLGLAAHLAGELGDVRRQIVAAPRRPAGDGQVHIDGEAAVIASGVTSPWMLASTAARFHVSEK